MRARMRFLLEELFPSPFRGLRSARPPLVGSVCFGITNARHSDPVAAVPVHFISARVWRSRDDRLPLLSVFCVRPWCDEKLFV